VQGLVVELLEPQPQLEVAFMVVGVIGILLT
jgi:hypothetical protein